MRPASNIVCNSVFTNGIIGPSLKMLGPVSNPGTVVFTTAPGCWGPMITPKLKGGHEVTMPVAVSGANVGDAIACDIKNIRVLSRASSSGVSEISEGACESDPTVDKKCPNCGRRWPEAKEIGIGLESIVCAHCGAPVSPFRMRNGYTMVFDTKRRIGLTVGKKSALKIARSSREWGLIPKRSVQFSALLAARADLVGVVSGLRAFMGQLGTMPSKDLPDSHNAGDVGYSLVGARHEWALTEEELAKHRTDGHLDCDSVRTGAILICPVKIGGGGVYAGDAHAVQGDGEIAGHTADVAAECTVRVLVVKGLTLDGPIILPPKEDLPYAARPKTEEEMKLARKLAKEHGITIEESGPIQIVGSGPDLNKATYNGIERAANLLGISADEVKNRATISGAIEIARLPGIITVSLLAPRRSLEKIGLAGLVRKHYNLPW